ncbi:MAG: ATP-binding protein [Deltaproteobacteria bacterium]|nr:ATP-binding protein [Deltaproteobacteria bacterium]
MSRAYQPRLIDGLIATLLGELPALLVVGPRASGKTTTAARHARTIVRLDREAEAVAVRADPDAVLRTLPEPVLLDEWQLVPGVLGAVKRAVDADPRPGRFILTGSVRAELEAQQWPGTGRVVRVALAGMNLRELLGRTSGPSVLDRLGGGATLQAPADPPDLRGYVELALRSGYPEPALHLSPAARDHWLASYVEALLTRDAEGVEGGRDPLRLRRFFEALAVNTAGLAADKTLFEAAGINRKTATAYERLLSNLLVVESVPAWADNRLTRLVRSAKRYLTDAALVAAVLRLDAGAVLRDGDVLGRLLDTFVASQLRAELAVATSKPRLFHVRQEHGRREIDLVAELAGRRVVAFEVKADSAPRPAAADHLAWLRDRLGERFVVGVLLHTGPRVYPLGDRLCAAPIAALWT